MIDSFAELRDKYKSTFAKKSVDIQAAWDDKDIKNLSGLIHKLTGSSGGYGFDDLCVLCQKTMKLFENKEGVDSPQVADYIQQILKMLKK
jgi:hypothetical protein